MDCVARKEGFSQVCVWPGTLVGAEEVAKFEQYMFDEFDVRVQYLEEIYIIPGESYTEAAANKRDGSCELFFAVHDTDTVKFAVPRLLSGIRWVEDVLSEINDESHWYPEYVKHYKIW